MNPGLSLKPEEIRVSGQAMPPGAVLMFDENLHFREPDNHARSSSAIRGVLPMNLKLDLWLVVVSLPLRGGEYFPSWIFREHAQTLQEAAAEADRADGSHRQPPPAGTDVARFGILEMIARGHQNKV
jgi:DNA-binding NarL/FixJ family response regulator